MLGFLDFAGFEGSGGVKLSKIDNDLDENYAQGDATIQGAEFTIYNQSKETVMVGGKEISKGGEALTITTGTDGIAATSLAVNEICGAVVGRSMPVHSQPSRS